ncbi:uncharacterized protein LOC143283377 [Babylonia areolata]|uniref:uncharacterized protein LOC143283377 n=1 Tax=Babylonia areolata TaxID=304850 RepID=UPI003FD0ACBE
MLSTSVVFSVLLAVAAAQSLGPGSFPHTCAATLCAVGHHCVLKEEPCDNPPCLSQPVCVPDTPSKQGVCHKPMFSLPSWLCRSRCESDVECPGAQKCCPSYCGSRCQDPQPAPLPRSGPTCEPPCAAGYHCVLKEEPCDNPPCLSQPVCVPVTPSKDGVCPKPGATDGDNCTSTCQQDSDCDGRDKCCEVSCGATVCQTPVGLTSVRSRHSTCARMHCLPDHYCVLRMKCYGRGCKSISLKPYCEPRLKKGCPVNRIRMPGCRGVRRDKCSEYDPSSCRSGSICCATVCGRRCVRPLRYTKK